MTQFFKRRATPMLMALAALVPAVLALNAVLSIYVWAPVGRFALAAVPVGESLAVFWLTLLAVRTVSDLRRRRFVLAGLGFVVGVLIGFSVAEGFFRFFFARAFMPAGDIGMVRGALLLFFGDIGARADVLTPITITLIFAVLGLIGAAIVAGVAALELRLPATRDGLLVLTVVALPIMVAVGLPESLVAKVVTGWYEQEPEFVEVVVDQPPADPDPGSTRESEQYAFPGLMDRDLYFFAVEAYGYASVVRPELAEQIDPARERFEAALERNGYSVRSSYLESPVAGGYSWLAEATFLTGQLVNSQERFVTLTERGFSTFTGMFHAGGYYTVTVRPGTVHSSWPEAWDLYRFKEAIVAHDGDFGFHGPWFSYVPVTDQYALWTGHKRIEELTAPGGPAAERPLLAYYQLVSSHTPFNAIPPIIEPWEALGDGSVYNERAGEILRFDNTWTGGSQLQEGYVAAITYVFDVLTEYVDTVMDHSRNPVMIVFGDHQPQRPIRSPDAFLSVPIHVASRDEAIVQRFGAIGYEAGMKSSEEPPHRHMTTFYPTLAELAR